MYNSIAWKEGADVPEADPAEVAPYEEVAKAIAGTTSEQHPGVVGRFVKQAGEDTMLQNAARDGAEFAWTPGGRGCAFCLMLASRGWQRVSKRTLKKIGPDGRWIHAEHIHPHCKCDYSIRFNEDTEVEGYDPDALREQYENADGKDWREKMRNAFGKREKGSDESWDEKVIMSEIEKLVSKEAARHISVEKGFRISKNQKEIENAEWLINTFGGEITLLTKTDRLRPDYLWNGELWDLKTPEGISGNSVDKLVHHGMKQIISNPGGILLNLEQEDIDLERAIDIAKRRIIRSKNTHSIESVRLIVRYMGKLNIDEEI